LSNGNVTFTANYDYNSFIIILDPNKDYNSTRTILSGHNINIYSMIKLTNDKFATCCYKIIKLWDIKNNYNCSETINAHSERISCLLFTGDFLISGSYDKTIKVWESKNKFKCVKTIHSDKDEDVLCLLFLPKGYFASGYADSKMNIWDLKKINCVNVLKGHENAVYSLVLLKDNRIMSDSYDKLINWSY
jgi:WD40 repeat protein